MSPPFSNVPAVGSLSRRSQRNLWSCRQLLLQGYPKGRPGHAHHGVFPHQSAVDLQANLRIVRSLLPLSSPHRHGPSSAAWIPHPRPRFLLRPLIGPHLLPLDPLQVHLLLRHPPSVGTRPVQKKSLALLLHAIFPAIRSGAKKTRRRLPISKFPASSRVCAYSVSDAFPIGGYRRKPYLFIAGIMGFASWVCMSLFVNGIWSGFTCMLIGSTAIAIAVIISE